MSGIAGGFEIMECGSANDSYNTLREFGKPSPSGQSHECDGSTFEKELKIPKCATKDDGTTTSSICQGSGVSYLNREGLNLPNVPEWDDAYDYLECDACNVGKNKSKANDNKPYYYYPTCDNGKKKGVAVFKTEDDCKNQEKDLNKGEYDGTLLGGNVWKSVDWMTTAQTKGGGGCPDIPGKNDGDDDKCNKWMWLGIGAGAALLLLILIYVLMHH